jgi:transketolase
MAAKQIQVLQDLQSVAKTIRRETLLIHQKARETRIASSLSTCEILGALFYGGILKFKADEPMWSDRDRFVISKGHGAIAMYPILADLGFISREELETVCTEGSRLGGIPDPVIPGFETINGSLGHGLGVGCGIALSLANQDRSEQVYVLAGDGEMNEGAVWEALMFASHHRLRNYTLIVDQNTKCMLDTTSRVIDLSPLEEKISAFGFLVESVDGHNADLVRDKLLTLRRLKSDQPRALVAKTVKGKGVPRLESTPHCHVVTLTAEEIATAIQDLK